MSKENRVSPVEPSVRKQPLILWLRILQILSLALVFAAGYSYAKVAIRFRPNPQASQRLNQQAGSSNRVANHPRAVAKTSSQVGRPSVVQNQSGNSQLTVSSSPANANATFPSFPTTTLTSVPAFTDDSAAKNSPPALQQYTPPGADLGNRNSAAGSYYGAVVAAPLAYTTEFPLASTASPEETAANSSVAMMVAKIQQAKKEDKPELSAALKKQLLELFKLRHDAQAKEIEEMEKQLEQAKTLHAKRNEKQDEIVERRFRHLMNELDDLDWERGVKSPAAQTYSGTTTIGTVQPLYNTN